MSPPPPTTASMKPANNDNSPNVIRTIGSCCAKVQQYSFLILLDILFWTNAFSKVTNRSKR